MLFDARSQASSIGVLAAVLSIAFPVAIWLLVMRPWRPENRVQYAARFAMWAVVGVSTAFGGPVARALMGHKSRYLMSVGQTLKGSILLVALGGAILFGIGWVRSASRFPPDADGDPGAGGPAQGS